MKGDAERRRGRISSGGAARDEKTTSSGSTSKRTCFSTRAPSRGDKPRGSSSNFNPGARGRSIKGHRGRGISSSLWRCPAKPDARTRDARRFATSRRSSALAPQIRVGAEDDDEVPLSGTRTTPADERVEVDVDDDDDDLPPGRPATPLVMRGGARRGRRGRACPLRRPGLWMRHGDEARSAARAVVLEPRSRSPQPSTPRDPHAVIDANRRVKSGDRAREGDDRRGDKAQRGARTEPSPSRGSRPGQRHHLVHSPRRTPALPPRGNNAPGQTGWHSRCSPAVRIGASWRGRSAAATAPPSTLSRSRGRRRLEEAVGDRRLRAAREHRRTPSARPGVGSPTSSKPTRSHRRVPRVSVSVAARALDGGSPDARRPIERGRLRSRPRRRGLRRSRLRRHRGVQAGAARCEAVNAAALRRELPVRRDAGAASGRLVLRSRRRSRQNCDLVGERGGLLEPAADLLPVGAVFISYAGRADRSTERRPRTRSKTSATLAALTTRFC